MHQVHEAVRGGDAGGDALLRARAQLQEIQVLAHLGSWEWDVQANHVTWTDELYRIYGLQPQEFAATYEAYLERVHPDDRGRVATTMQTAHAAGERFDFEERIVRPDGEERVLHSVGRVERDASGQVRRLVGVCHDVTEWRATEEELRRREVQLATAQELTHLGSWDWAVVTGELNWSDEMWRVYGYAPGAVPLDFDLFLSRVHPADRERVADRVRSALASGEPFRFEHRAIRPDGTECWLDSRGEVVRDAAGNVVRMFGTGHDITEQRAAEAKERELIRAQAARAAAEASAKRMAFLAEASRQLGSSLDYRATLATVARLAVPEIADWCAVDLLDEQRRFQRLAVQHTDPDRVQLAHDLAERYPQDPRSDRGLYRVLATREAELGEHVPEEVLAQAAQDEQHLALLRELGLRSYVIVPLLLAGVVIGAISFVQAESDRTFTRADLPLLTDLARRAATAIHNAQLVQELERARQQQEMQAEALEAQAGELELQTEELQSALTELEQRNEDLEERTREARAAREAAESANRAKSQFLATMSHELRTPLNAIAGYSQLLEMGIHGAINEEQVEVVNRIQRNQRRLLGLINDVLNFAKLNAGRLHVRPEVFDLNALLAGLGSVFEPQMRARGLRYDVQQSAQPIGVFASRERAEQVLLNLLSNAVKFTPAGGRIRVTCTVADSEVSIDVSDTGPGIPAGRELDIFQPFVQVDPQLTRENEGMGLGLSISRELARAMNGELTVRSTAGEGATFTLVLPRAGLQGEEGIVQGFAEAFDPE